MITNDKELDEMENYNKSFSEIADSRISSKRIITCNICKGSGAVLFHWADSHAVRCHHCWGTGVRELSDVGETGFAHLVFDPEGKLDDPPA